MNENIFIYFLVFFSLFNIFMIISYWLERPPKRKPLKLSDELPLISIIVPAYNEEKNIEKTLKNLLKLNYPKNKLEIIVIDDGSKDRTYEIAKKFERFGVKVYRKENGGKASAVNYGIKRAKGKLIATLDADSFPEKDALLKMLPYFYSKKVMAVTPALLVHKPKNFWERLQYAEYLFGVFLRNAFAVKNALYVTPGPLSIYRREFFEKYGLFEEGNIAEDSEMAMRIQKYGYIIEHAIDAKVTTVSPKNFKQLLKQRVRWYRGFMDNTIKHKELFNIAKYGFFSLTFIFAYLSIMIAFSYVAYFSIKNFKMIYNKIYSWALVGFDIFHFSPYTGIVIKEALLTYLLSPIVLFGLLGAIMAFTLMYLTKKYSGIKDKIFFNVFLYIFFYSLIYWIFWALVFYTKITGKKIGWK